MKTHEIARSLALLAKILRAGPDIELSELESIAGGVPRKFMKANAPAALAMLAGLARYSKAEWSDLINEYDLGVPVNPTDSTRDLLGRLLNHLNEDESVRRKSETSKTYVAIPTTCRTRKHRHQRCNDSRPPPLMRGWRARIPVKS